jgi:hypothetical protein
MSKWKQMLEQGITSRYPLEVSRCHSKPATSLNPTLRAMRRSHRRTKDGMLEW